MKRLHDLLRRLRSPRRSPSPRTPQRAFGLEPLEPRLLLSADVAPIDPSAGEANLLGLIDSLPLNDIQSALDHFPIPYVVIASAGGGPPVVANNRAGAPTRVDADSSKATGKGGNDIQVEVNTELGPSPHLRLNVNRLGSGPFAEDLTVLIAFPFDAFTAELLPGPSNLFIGFQTTAADGSAGGHAPLSEEIRFIPGTLGGTDHTFEVRMNTVGDTNPLRFLAGHFDGDASTGLLNADAFSAWVQSVPDQITLGLDLAENGLLSPELLSAFGLSWTATSASRVAFEYAEVETPPAGTNDYRTTLTFDQMPTSEELSLVMDETAGTLVLGHRASAPIGEITLTKERRDGLLITGTARQVPTEVDLSIDFDPSVVLDVNDNTLDLELEVTRAGGIPNTGGFFGYNLGYAKVAVTDAPDLQATWSDAFDSFAVTALNPGESIGALEFLIGDDDQLELPPSYADVPTHHLFSLVDDGTHGTAVGRLLNVRSANLDLNADATKILQFETTQPAPAQIYLRTTPDSTVVPLDAEITCDIDDLPAGTVDLHFDGPGKFGYVVDPPAEIASIHCFGHVGNLNFDIDAGGLPPVFEFDFEPDEYLTVLAEDGFGGPDRVGHLAVRLWDEVTPTGLPNSTALFGAASPLRDARARVDDLPSFHATWSDTPGSTAINFSTDAFDAFVGGAQVSLSTAVELAAALPPAALSPDHYARFEDEGGSAPKRLAAGAFGIDEFAYASNDAAGAFDLHYDANLTRPLEVVINATFGSRFFPDYAVHTIDGTTPVLRIDAVPHQLDVALDLDPEFHYLANSPIDSIAIDAVVDDTNDGADNGTTIDFDLVGLPNQLDFVLNPASHASLVMSGPVDLIALRLESNADIFGSGYRLIAATLDDLPAKWDAVWSGEVRLESRDQFDNPAPMGQVNVLLSKTNDPTENANSLALFDTDGFKVGRSAFQEEVDNRYWPGGVEDALADLYGDAERLDAGEDHVVTRGGSDFVSVQFTGFQKIALTPQPGGGTFEFNAPVPGLHPLYVGLEDGGDFTSLQFENIPDHLLLTVDIPGQFVDVTWTDDVMSSIGEIDLFKGPVNAGDGDSASRFVINDTPDQVTLSWNFGFPNGGVTFDASQEFQLLFLDQSGGSDRLVAGLELEDFHLGYGLELFSFDVAETIDTVVLGEWPVAWDLARFSAGFTAAPGVDGFLGLYEFIDSPANLNTGTAPSGGEFVPQYTLMMDDLTDVSVSFGLILDPLSLIGLGVGDFPLIPPISLDVDVNISADFVFDLWSNTETNENLVTIPGEAMAIITLGGITEDWDIGFLNHADYVENDPFHIWPITTFGLGTDHDWVFTFDGLHEFSDHFDPFAT